MELDQILEENNLSNVAKFILKDWKKVNFATRPYLDAMTTLTKITDNYFHDDGKSIVNYFLANATGYRGENARKIKKYLNNLIDEN